MHSSLTLLLYFNTNKPQSFFLQNTSCIRKPQVISGGGGGGVRTSCTLPLDPPQNILSSIRLDGRTLYSTENGSLILENWACFAECYLFLGCGFGESVYSIAYFLQEEEQEYPGRTRLYCHITTLSSITEWILCFVKEVFFFLYSVPFRQCHSHSHRHVQASSTIVLATWTRQTEQRYSKTKQSSEYQ